MCIEIDNILVNVEIVRKNNKNTYMRVKNGVLVVTTNYMVSDRKIKEIIINNKNSIIKMLEKDNKLNEKTFDNSANTLTKNSFEKIEKDNDVR